MNGSEIFAFTLRKVPEMCRVVLREAGVSMDSIDSVVMHQANEFMLRHIAKGLRIPDEKFVVALEKYGNTSSASIPLAMTEALGQKLRTGGLKLLLAGFGVGFSWAAAVVDCGPMMMPEVSELGADNLACRPATPAHTGQ